MNKKIFSLLTILGCGAALFAQEATGASSGMTADAWKYLAAAIAVGVVI